MDKQLLEQLLYEDESTALDFKRDQYPFSGAGDREKSELLKDILAFANSWRRSTAYVLIGVDEVKGGRSTPVGVTKHLEDASLQQFVHSKTNRPVEFHYRALQLDGVAIGIIEIPLQERPSYLAKDFGKLSKDTVYVRRGSSTGVADLAEVARMGAADAGVSKEEPGLVLEFADVERRERLGKRLEIESSFLQPRVDPSPFRVRPPSGSFGYVAAVPVNNTYHEELVEYVANSALLREIGLAVENSSGRAARTVELRLSINAAPGLHLVDQEDRPELPSKSLIAGVVNWRDRIGPPRPVPRVRRHGDRFEVVVRWDSILPGATAWTEDVFLLGAKESQVVGVEAELFCEEFTSPLEEQLEIEVRTTQEPMDPKVVARADAESY